MKRRSLLALPLSLALAACASPAPSAPASSFDQNPIALDETRLVRVSLADRDAILQAAFARSREDVDALGLTHVRAIQQIDGIPVLGGDAIVHYGVDGAIYEITGTRIQNVDVDTRPRINAVQAKEVVREALAAVLLDFSARARTADDLAEPTLAIVATSAGDKLVWSSSSLIDHDETPMQLEAMIDAHTGAIVQLRDVLETAKPGSGAGTPGSPAAGTGQTLYSGSVGLTTSTWSSGGYRLYDTASNARTTDMLNRTSGLGTLYADADNTWGSSLKSDKQSAAADAHYGARLTYDYFKLVHGRAGIDGSNNTTLPYGYTFSRVHYGRNYNNAFWSDSCGCMTYGDGDGVNLDPLVSIDVAAHEMSHGITSRTAALIYSGESGGINEANSDIFGTAVEFYANNPSDSGDWLIGEEFDLRAVGSLRSMEDPASDGRSIDHYSNYAAGMDVHYSSGLGNHFFYLLTVGGTNRTSGQSVSGIGLGKAEQIWFRALTVYMTSGTNYAGARTATLNAASDLYGASSAEAAAVAATWTACGVN